jgi:predicted Zn-ribbon and HTH transcriptional regulator
MTAKRDHDASPPGMHDTVRHAILAALREEGPLSAREISQAVGISEKEVADHLGHLRKTLAAEGGRLLMTPPECRKCGFVFAKRERLTKPGRCPVCKGEAIRPPAYALALRTKTK